MPAWRRFLWILKRIRAMDLREVVSRIVWRVRLLTWWLGQLPKAPEPATGRVQDPWEVDEEARGDRFGDVFHVNAAQRQGSFEFLNVDARERDFNWHRDPQSGRVAPRTFGPFLNYRDPKQVGNARNIWEKNRHHHLVGQAVEARLTDNESAGTFVVEQLEDWRANNPFPYGVNYASNLELGVRLINWVFIERLLRGEPPHEQLFGPNGSLWNSIYRHQLMLYCHPAPGSSANNHLIGEMAGLFVSTLVWPVFEPSEKWNRFARRRLESSLREQVFEGGVNKEQAFGYHMFTLEAFLVVYVEALRFGVDFSDEYVRRLRAMLDVVRAMQDRKGHLPAYGDSDDGHFLRLKGAERFRLQWMEAASKILFDRRTFRNQTPGNGWFRAVFGDVTLESRVPEIKQRSTQSDVTQAGHYPIVSDRGGSEEIFCLFNAAPLGYLSIAAHGHADALSFTLNVSGEPLIVDPGTYTYHYDPAWRQYFRGTRAHNTVCLDEADQVVSGGLFLWESDYDVTVSKWSFDPDGGEIHARHDGYTRLPGSPVHERILRLSDRTLHVRDRLVGHDEHTLEWRLHFAPQVDCVIDREVCHAQGRKGSVSIQLDDRLHWTLLSGETEGGWYSPAFNVKQECCTLSGSLRAELPVETTHRFQISPDG